VAYACRLEDLLTVLYDSAPAKADAVALQRRWVEHGLLAIRAQRYFSWYALSPSLGLHFLAIVKSKSRWAHRHG
jgi:hypothetical protein